MLHCLLNIIVKFYPLRQSRAPNALRMGNKRPKEGSEKRGEVEYEEIT